MIRLRMALPLIFALALTSMPFLLLEYTYFQSNIMLKNQLISRWERKAENFYRLFSALSSYKTQLELQFYYFQEQIKELKIAGKADAKGVAEVFQTQFKGHLQPTAVFAGILDRKTEKIKLFKGDGFTSAKSYVIGQFMEYLCSSRTYSGDELNQIEKRRRGIFGEIAEFTVLKAYKGKALVVLYEGRPANLYWQSHQLDSDSELVYLSIFHQSKTSFANSILYVLNNLAEEYPELNFALVPIEAKMGDLRPLIDNRMSAKLKAGLLSLLDIDSAGSVEREVKLPYGRLFIDDTLVLIREFIDFEIPYEVWVVTDIKNLTAYKTPFFLFVLRLAFISFWILSLAKVLISGRPLGVSLSTWLYLMFVVIGIIPLFVLYMAGLFHIESSTFRKQQEAINEVVQQLEDVDTSSETLMSGYRNIYRKKTQNKLWLKHLSSGDENLIDRALIDMHDSVMTEGFSLDAAIVYRVAEVDPEGPMNAQIKKFGNAFSEEEVRSMNAVFEKFIRFAHRDMFVKRGEKTGNKPFYRGNVGDSMLKYFLRNSGDTDYFDFDEIKYLYYHNYLQDSDSNFLAWYILISDLEGQTKEYLLKSVEKLQEISQNNIYALLKFSANNQDILFPYKTSNLFSVFKNAVDKKLELAAFTKTILSFDEEDRLIFLYTCQKSGNYILGSIVDMAIFKTDAIFQEMILLITLILLALPVLLFASIISRYLVMPLKKVKTGLDKINSGDFNVMLKLSRKDELGLLSEAFDQMANGIRARINLGRFVASTLNFRITSDNQDVIESGLKKRYGAILFSDIRSFTNLSEMYPAREIVSMLNDHLGLMANCVEKNNGLVEQYIGDAILAVFYAHSPALAAENAISAASLMMNEHQKHMDERHARNQFVFRIGIGIESGELYAGRIKVGLRNEYALVGKSRVIAEHLEQLSKGGIYTNIIVSPNIKDLLQKHEFAKLSTEENYELKTLEPTK